jgi:hypothetical protein
MPHKVYALRGIFILRASNKKPGGAQAGEYAFQLYCWNRMALSEEMDKAVLEEKSKRDY